MGLKEKILEKSADRIVAMEKSECPQSIKEKSIRERQISRQILEIVCGTQGITLCAAIRILNEAESTIKEIAMSQEI